VLATIALVTSLLNSGPHWSEVCIKGDHLDAVLPLFKQLKYKLVGQVRQVDAEKARDMMTTDIDSRTRVRKAAYLTGTRRW